MTLEEQRDGYASELAMLDAAARKILSRMHYCTVYDILVDSGLPYTLVQDVYDDLGVRPLRHGYRYRFTSKWSSKAMLYVQETGAGRQHRLMRDAIASLRGLLKDRLAEVERAIVDIKQKEQPC